MEEESNLRIGDQNPRRLSWSLDQLRIDQATNTPPTPQPQAQPSSSATTTSNQSAEMSSTAASRSIPSVPIPQGAYWQGMNDPYDRDHATFRSRFVGRIPAEERISTIR